jgi:protein TonB
MLRFLASLGLALLGHLYLFQYTIDVALEIPPELISNTSVSVTFNDSFQEQPSTTTTEKSTPPPQVEQEETPLLTPLPTVQKQNTEAKKNNSVPVEIKKTIQKKKVITVPKELEEVQTNTLTEDERAIQKHNEQPQQRNPVGKRHFSQNSANDAEKITKTYKPAPSRSSVIKARPQHQNNPKPEYPQFARIRGWEGIVSLLVEVTENGDVQSIELHESCGYKILDKAAIRAVKTWRFIPSTRDGKQSQSTVVVPVHFKLYDE